MGCFMKGVEWIKLATCMCEDEKMRLINSMVDTRDSTFYVWIRLLMQAGRVNDNGLIYMRENIAYTSAMLSVIFERPVDIIEKAFKILEDFGMIEIYENSIIKITNWEKHQNIEAMNRVREKTKERVKNFRERKKSEGKLGENKEIQASKKYHNNTRVNEREKEESKPDILGTKKCNASVTQQREKREKDIKKKNKNSDKEERELIDKSEEKASEEEITKETEIKSQDEVNIDLYEVSNPNEEINIQALKIIKYLEETKVNIKGLTLNWLIEALGIHKGIYVIMAINAAVKRNKFDICYISGILKNWLIEGYPKTYEEMEFESLKEKPNLRFNNFKAREYDYEDLEERLLGWKE